MAKELTYNLPGYGFTHCNMFGQTIDLMNLLETVGIIEKMQSTCQLGTMKYVYPGAMPSRTRACARRVAVVVPSPATSFVFVATSLTS